MILGTDAAMHQRGADWRAIAAEGVRYAFIKATEGQGYTDPCWSDFAAQVRAAGILLGAYHVLWPNRDPLQQARHFHATAGHLAELPPVLDWELMKGCAPHDVHACAVAFVEETERLWGRECIVYTYPSFVVSLGTAMLKSPLASRPLWIAHYGVPAPSIPKPWTSWRWWQYDGDGGRRYPSGQDADYNWFDGTERELLDLAGRLPDTDPAPAPPVPVEVPNAADFVATLATDEETT